MSALPPISPNGSVGQIAAKSATEIASNDSVSSSKDDKQNMFLNLLANANQDQVRSEVAVQDLVTGKNDDVQQVVMEVVKAEMSFQVFMEVRNQLVETYNDLMRMQF
jgi:flagellar hook-basal body complex protein FliE